MTENRMIRNIRKRLKDEHGLEASIELVKAIINIEADEIYQIIALEDTYKYVWGTISGVEKVPKKVTGMFSELYGVRKNGGYSN